MIVKCYAEPMIEPISLSEAKVALNLDSGSFADNVDQIQSFPSGEKSFSADVWTANVGDWVEVLGYSAVVSFATGAFTGLGTVDMRIQESDDQTTIYTFGTDFTQVATLGMTTTAALGIGTTPANVAYGLFSYFVAGTGYSKPALAAGVAPGDDVIAQGKYGAVAFDIGANNAVDVIEATNQAAAQFTTVALAVAALPAAEAGHVRMGYVTVMKSDGAFTFGTTALSAATTVAYTSTAVKYNYAVTYEKAYTGTRRYIRTIAKVLVANCSFGTSVIRSAPSTTDDDLLTELITAGTASVENDTSKKIMNQTWDYFPKCWPDGDRLKIPFGQLVSVTSVSYFDIDDTPSSTPNPLTENVDYYVEKNGDQCGFIVLPYGKCWPSETLATFQPIAIRFVCGWTTQTEVPAVFKQAIKKWCVNNYANRGDDVIGQTVSEDRTYSRLINLCGRLFDMDFL